MEEMKRMRLTHRRQLEDAARTCVLSKSWLHAWSTILTLRFCQSSKLLTKQQEKRYLRLMRWTIRRYHKDNIPIITCDLHFGIRKPKSSTRAEKFIKRVASKRPLKELCLTVVDDVASITLPDEIFSMLELLDVRIMEEVLHNLLSTCKLLEKINLRLPEGLNKILVKNLLYHQELKMTTDSDSNDASLETHNLPRLCSLFYQTPRIPLAPVLSITDAIWSLRVIFNWCEH
ncbi:hypothetical protein Tco_1542963 [Tanacetum coccineum]